MDRIVPGIDVPYYSAVIRHVSRRTQKDSAHMHQLAEGEIHQERRDKKKVRVKDGPDMFA